MQPALSSPPRLIHADGLRRQPVSVSLVRVIKPTDIVFLICEKIHPFRGQATLCGNEMSLLWQAVAVAKPDGDIVLAYLLDLDGD